MVKKTHTQGGVLFALIMNPFIRNVLEVEGRVYACFLMIIYIYGAYFGSVLPDIDMKNSYISKKVPLLYQFFGKHFKHRGFTHSIMFVMILGCLTVGLVGVSEGDYVIKLFFGGLLVGYISHIFLDLFTHDGVYLLLPYKKVIRLADIKTNSKKEKKIEKILQIAAIMSLGANCYVMIIM